MKEKFLYVILFAIVIVFILLLNWYIKWQAYGKRESLEKKALAARKAAALKGLIVNCPLCGSALLPGEDLVSRVYRPMNVPDQLMIVMGCPHCYPVCESGVKRICPVCHKSVEANQSLTARLFNKTAGKKHVHVIGCSNCHSPRAD